MESIDSLLNILQSQRGRELRFEVGQRARLITEEGVFDLSQTPLTAAETRAFLGPIVPEDARQSLIDEPITDFNYDCSGVGMFSVRAIKNSGAMSFYFIPGAGATNFSPPGRGTGPLSQPGASAPSAPQRHTGSLSQPNAPQPGAYQQRQSGPLSQAGAPQAGASQPGAYQRQSGPLTPPSAPQRPSGSLSQPAPTPAPPVRPPHVSSGPMTMDSLLTSMFHAGASDLHMSVSMPPMIRKDGQMAPMDPSQSVLTSDDTRRLLSSIMPKRNAEEFERRNDTDFAYEIMDLARFRCNVFKDRKGMGGVFRVIPNKILTAEDLKLSQEMLRLCHLNKGLVLVTGPTGSGKSTTLCALIDYINRNRTDHIITIEDPIEFVHENKKCLINQREVNSHTDSFRDALRAALREDPDIVLVGEMRDLETVAIAIETAETGHLVFGTLHTTTAASTVDRIIDQFPPDRQTQIRIMLSESLRGVISQTLLRKQGGGRVAALETLIVNSAISNLIREAKTFQIASVMQTQKSAGNIMLNDALINLVNKKLVAPEEAYSKAIDKMAFETLLKRANVDTKFIVQSIM